MMEDGVATAAEAVKFPEVVIVAGGIAYPDGGGIAHPEGGGTVPGTMVCGTYDGPGDATGDAGAEPAAGCITYPVGGGAPYDMTVELPPAIATAGAILPGPMLPINSWRLMTPS
jgi:hypothetical protein